MHQFQLQSMILQFQGGHHVAVSIFCVQSVILLLYITGGEEMYGGVGLRGSSRGSQRDERRE